MTTNLYSAYNKTHLWRNKQNVFSSYTVHIKLRYFTIVNIKKVCCYVSL